MRKRSRILNHSYVKSATTALWVRNLQNGRNEKPMWSILQNARGTIDSDGYIFMYSEDKETLICVARKPYKALCFKVEFDPVSKLISVDISYNKGCAQNRDLPRGEGTLAMLKAILRIIIGRSDINNYNAVIITDNSLIELSYNQKIRLMDMTFVSTGCTWYSTLVPMFLKYKDDEIWYLSDREKILRGPSWNEFIARIPTTKTQEIFNTAIQFDNDTKRQLPAHQILDLIRKRRDNLGLFTYIDDILLSFNVSTMRGKEWIIPLQNGKIVYSDDLDLCKPSDGWIIPDEYMINISGKQYDVIKQTLQKEAPQIGSS